MSWSLTDPLCVRARLLIAASSLALAACASVPPRASPAGVGGTLRFAGRQDAGTAIRPVVVILEPEGSYPGEDRVPRLFTVASSTDRFDPPFSAIAMGDYVVFANDGEISHRLFSADLGAELQIPLGPVSSSDLVRLGKPGEVRFFCSLHPDEHFSVLVMDAAYFDVPDAAGRYYVGPVPEGTYRLSVWTRAQRTPVRTVAVASGSTLDEPIVIDGDLIPK